jgi:hypothetical protein
VECGASAPLWGVVDRPQAFKSQRSDESPAKKSAVKGSHFYLCGVAGWIVFFTHDVFE